MSLMALMYCVHSDRAILPRRNCFLLIQHTLTTTYTEYRINGDQYTLRTAYIVYCIIPKWGVSCIQPVSHLSGDLVSLHSLHSHIYDSSNEESLSFHHSSLANYRLQIDRLLLLLLCRSIIASKSIPKLDHSQSHQQIVFESLGVSRSVREDVEYKLRCVIFRRVSDCRRAVRPAFRVTEISDLRYRSTMGVIVISLGMPRSAGENFQYTWGHLGALATSLGAPVTSLEAPATVSNGSR
jgi:hypothetical protein